MAKVEAEKTEVKAETKAEVKSEKVMKLKNNTKGLRHVAGVKVLPGKSVELSPAQLKAVNENPVALAWIKSGDLTLA